MVRIGWLLTIVLTAVVGLMATQSPAESPRAAVVPPTPPVTGKAIGSIGCNAASCHGNVQRNPLTDDSTPENIWQVSGIIWNRLDPHARAYAVLEGPLGKQIENSLKDNFDGEGKKIPATKDIRCLACHVNPTIAGPEHVALHSQGVGCESCHGNASQWEAAHTFSENRGARPATWPGFNDMNNLDVRASTCVGCHVGDSAHDGMPVRDMNHDMIAAGHPRLDAFTFEQLAARVPKHWVERDRTKYHSDGGKFDKEKSEKERNAEFGQCALPMQTRNRETLLGDRAARANSPRSPWPEFAESRCEGCHFPLTGSSKGNVGVPPWSAPSGKQTLRDYLNSTVSPIPAKVLELLKTP